MPQSTTMIVSSYSSAVMFFPISPTPPKNMTFSFFSPFSARFSETVLFFAAGAYAAEGAFDFLCPDLSDFLSLCCAGDFTLFFLALSELTASIKEALAFLSVFLSAFFADLAFF